MKIISHKNKLIKIINGEKNLGFVPTMGGIHLGHESLIKRSKAECNKTIVSIFINKPQFNQKKDFQKYPRLLRKDILTLKKLRVDYLFTPSHKQIYPKGTNKKIKIDKLEKKLCGKLRPGHFRAVVDVLDRFIEIIKPKNIYLGEKDMQQLRIVKNFLINKKIETKVISCKTIREKNGMAYSSRNFLLSKKQKKIGSKVYKIILNQKKKIIKNRNILKIIKKNILLLGVNKIDYLELLNKNNLTKKKIKKNNFRIFIAYYLGKIRLIDNI